MAMNSKPLFVDCHVHSTFSPDSVIDMQQACQKAVERGLRGIAFTDHLDIDYPNPAFFFEFDWNKREALLQLLREQYGNALILLSGVEMGFRPETLERSLKFVKHSLVDFIIMSIHVIDGQNLCVDGDSHYFITKTKKQAFTGYLEAIYHSVCDCKDYDVVGHIGYIRRYMPYQDKTMAYAEYSDIIDGILKQVIVDNKGIEINTSGYRDNLGGPLPDMHIVKRYKELGGTMVTIGSDAHASTAIGHSFQDGVELLKECGFSYVTHFEKHKPVFTKIA